MMGDNSVFNIVVRESFMTLKGENVVTGGKNQAGIAGHGLQGGGQAAV